MLEKLGIMNVGNNTVENRVGSLKVLVKKYIEHYQAEYIQD